jgi:hypothetical protein
MAVQLIDKGFGVIQAKLARLKFLELAVGIQGEEAQLMYGKDINLATVATYLEFGTEDIPARSFLRAAVFEGRDKIIRLYANAYTRMVGVPNFSPDEMLAMVGTGVVKMIELKIDRSYSWAKPNADSTVKAKGFDYPLHETDVMSETVTWVVRNKIGSILLSGGSSG